MKLKKSFSDRLLGNAHLGIAATAKELEILMAQHRTRKVYDYVARPESLIDFSPATIVEDISMVGFTVAETIAFYHRVWVFTEGGGSSPYETRVLYNFVPHKVTWLDYRMQQILGKRVNFTPDEQGFWRRCIARLAQEMEVPLAVIRHFIGQDAQAPRGTANHQMFIHYQRGLEEYWSGDKPVWPGFPYGSPVVSSGRPGRRGFVELPLLPVLAAIGLGMQLASGSLDEPSHDLRHLHTKIEAPQNYPRRHNIHRPFRRHSDQHHQHHSHSSIHPDLALPITGIGINASLGTAVSVESLSLVLP